jgi:hypothetical protein
LSTYTTVDLIPLAGHNNAKAFGLNDNGLAVGTSHLVGDSSQDAAVVWSVDEFGDASVSPLPGIDSARSIHAVEVNNQGMIVGESKIPEDEGGHTHAVVWIGAPGSYAVHDLDTLGEEFVWSHAHSISEPDTSGNVWVVGISGTIGTPENPQIRRGVLWQVDSGGEVLSMTDLEPSSSNVDANDVKVIGDSVFVAGDFAEHPQGHAVIWAADLSGVVVGRTELGTADFNGISAYALNSAGDAIGEGFNSALERNGFLYESSDGSITDLGSLGNNGSRALGINDSDVVVGRYENYRTQGFYTIEEHAFVWDSGTMYKLLDQVSDRTFWWLYTAFDVNANGEIVGNGAAGKRNDSEGHGFLARPEDAAGQNPPVAVDDAASTLVGTAVTINVLANDYDPDGDTISIMSFTQGTHGTVTDNGDGTLAYTPVSAAPASTDTFTYTITDGDPLTADATATVTIDILAAGEERVYTGEDGPLNIGDLKTVTSIVEATFDDPINAVNVEINFTHAAPETLVISLFSPSGGDSLTLVPSGTPGLYGVEIPAGGIQHAGTWTLQIHDPLKDRQRGTLYGWTLIVNPNEPVLTEASAATAVDLALAVWGQDDSSDDDTDRLVSQTADELALMLFE